MTKLSPHFSLKEFECRGLNCCGRTAAPTPALIEALEHLRLLITNRRSTDTPLKIRSGFRCRTHNLRVSPNVPNSWHTRGMAADLAIPAGLDIFSFLDAAIATASLFGIGVYDWGLHVDVRSAPRTIFDRRSKPAFPLHTIIRN